MRVWRAVLSSLRVLTLASTTKGLSLGCDIVDKKEDEEEEEGGNAQEWRKEREEANIVSHFTVMRHTTVSPVYRHLILLPQSLLLAFSFQASPSIFFISIFLNYLLDFWIILFFLLGFWNMFSSWFFEFECNCFDWKKKNSIMIFPITFSNYTYILFLL